MPKPSQEPPASSKASNEDLKDLDLFEPSKPRLRAKILHMGVSKTGDQIHIKIEMSNSSQVPLAFSKAQKKYLKDKDVLCTLEIKIKSQISGHGYTKDQ